MKYLILGCFALLTACQTIDTRYDACLAKVADGLGTKKECNSEYNAELARRSTFASGMGQALAASGNSNQNSQPAAVMKQIDFQCMQRCQASGSLYGFCKSKCEY